MNPQPAPAPARRLRGLSLAGLAAAGLLVALWLMLGAAQPPAWAGGSYAVLQTYANPNPAPVALGGEEFGYSLAYLPGSDQLIVGARSDQVTTTIAGGLAYILDATTGATEFVLKRTTPISNDLFGASVSGVLTAVVVGAPKVDVSGPGTNDGAVYLFDATTGALVHAYPHPAAAANDEFGSAVAIISDTIVVGVPKYDSPLPASNVGRVYLCSITDGNCPAVVENPSTGAAGGGDQFGLSLVAIPGGFAVGAPLDGSHGTVYVYAYDGVTATVSAVISTTTSGTGDEFGRALALVGNNLLIGAANDNTGASDAGVAYLYTLSGTLLKTFTNPTPHNNDHFGAAVSGDSSLIVIGSADDDQGATDAGLVHLYDNNGTTYPFIQSVGPVSATTGLAFGFALAPLGGDFAVSAVKADLGATDAGAVYRVGYEAIPPTATATATATAVPNGVYMPVVVKP